MDSCCGISGDTSPQVSAAVGELDDACVSFFHASSSIMVSMNRLDTASRAMIVRCLIVGISIRSTVRITGASKNTVAKLLAELGAACAVFMNDVMVNYK